MLDRSRPFGTFGYRDDGIKFEQDGIEYYYNDKPVIEEMPKKEATKPVPKKRGRKPAKKD